MRLRLDSVVGPRGVQDTLATACRLADQLLVTRRLHEAKKFLNEQIPLAQKVLGPDHIDTLMFRYTYVKVLCGFVGQTPKELQYSAKQKRALDEVISELEDVFKRVHRVFGPSHSYSKELSGKLDRLRNLRRQHAHRFQST